MIWQDIVIAIANLLFTYSLVHQVYYGFRKKKGLLTLTTAGLTSIGLYAVVVTFFTLQLYYSAIVSLINAILWTVLLVQRIVYKGV